MKLILSKSALLAALIAAAKKDIRYYLNGVNVRYVPSGKASEEAEENPVSGTLVFVGTDGHMLFAGTTPAVWEGLAQTRGFDLIIPGDVVKSACKGKSAVVALESLSDGRYTLGDSVFAAVDGKYPDYMRVIPATVSGELGQYNPELLARGLEALRVYFDKDRMVPTCHYNGKGAAVLAGSSRDAVVVVMPWVASEPYTGFAMPAEAQPVEAQEEKIAA